LYRLFSLANGSLGRCDLILILRDIIIMNVFLIFGFILYQILSLRVVVLSYLFFQVVIKIFDVLLIDSFRFSDHTWGITVWYRVYTRNWIVSIIISLLYISNDILFKLIKLVLLKLRILGDMVVYIFILGVLPERAIV